MKQFGVGSLASFRDFEQIGEGTYGIVYRAVDKKTNETVALKKYE
jgi:serine/threonine protein kinase